MLGFQQAEIWCWHSLSHGGDPNDAPLMFQSERDDIEMQRNLKGLISDLKDVRDRRSQWQEYCAIEFLSVSSDDAEDLMAKFPEVKL